MPTNPQEEFWKGSNGDRYLERNFDEGERYQIRRPFYELFEEFPHRDYSILEVGCNCGINLQILKRLGFNNVAGIDIHPGAIEEAEQRLPGTPLRVGSLLELPFEDCAFDIVFSSGVLIHQDPHNSLFRAMDEMYRVAGKYIIGFEEYCEETVTVEDYSPETVGIDGVPPGFYWRAPYSTYWQDPGVYTWKSKKRVTASPPPYSYMHAGNFGGTVHLNELELPKQKRRTWLREYYKFEKGK